MTDIEQLPYFKDKTFRNGSNAIMIKALFRELSYGSPEYWTFTVGPEDDVVQARDPDGPASDELKLYSLHKLFMAYVPNDPSEYTFAKAVFGEWKIWDRIRSSVHFKPYYEEMKAEAHIKIKSQALAAIFDEMRYGKNAFQAAKFLQQRGWIEEKTAAKKKEDKELDKRIVADYNEDANRLGLNLAN